MKRWTQRTWIKIIAVALSLSLIAAAVALVLSGTGVSWTGWAETVSRPFSRLAATVTSWAEQGAAYFQGVEALQAEKASLEKEVAQLQAAARAGELARPLELPRDHDLSQAADDLNHIQQGLQAAMEERTRSERMKVELISNVSHDLKTPLTSVIGYLTLLRDEPQISPEIRARYTGIALEKAERLEDLINEFFDITRFNLTHLELEKQPVDLCRMLQQVVSEFGPMLAEADLTCRLDLPEKLLCPCDGEKLSRVFDNLLRNASHYSLPGTEVRITGGRDGEYFALRVRGESMLNAGILPDDLVVVHRQPTAHNGEIVVALLGDEATVKRLSRRNGEVWLLPENENYRPIDGREATLLGKVTAVVREYN